MDNNAFKDLVRSYGKSNTGNSSKAIARKAVEEEFRRKKRKRSGDADSSSDEEDDHSYKKNKRKQQEENKDTEEDDAEAIQKDLSSRYRDRAKERREGRDGANEKTEASNNFLIVPHNIKGLDLSLARKERAALQSKSGGGNRKSEANKGEKEAEGATTIRDKMPTLEEAHEILQAFLSREKDTTNADDHDEFNFPTAISNGICQYLGELFKWKNLDVSTWEGEPAGRNATPKSLQHTKLSLAIDGHPSDSLKAWQIPRQYTLSRGAPGGLSQTLLLPIDLMNNIDAVFQKKNSIRDEMMERQASTSEQNRTKSSETKQRPTMAEKDNYAGVDEDDSDDDMFGGFDD